MVTYYRDLGVIFAAGNLPATHDVFEVEHCCNVFCKFFELPTDYDNWESSRATTGLPRYSGFTSGQDQSAHRYSTNPDGSKAMSFSRMD